MAEAYGWQDLDLGHGFYEMKQDIICEQARRTVLDRLLRLNHEHYAQEMEKELYEKGAKSPNGSKKKVEAGQDGDIGKKKPGREA